MSTQVYVNGQFMDADNASISVWDHGFLYGDGVFEGIRAYAGRVFRLDQHLHRLYDSARHISLTMPMPLEEMRDLVLETCRRNQIQDGYIRLVASRGKGDLGLDPRKCSRPTVVIIADGIKLYPPERYEQGLRLIISSVQRIAPQALDVKIKSLNYLNNILAKIEANTAGVDEAVMLTANGCITECTSENIFAYKNGILRTPARHLGILEGVTRAVVLELARADKSLRVEETMVHAHDLYVADEVFLSGTGAELIPVVWVAGRTVGDGKPGPVFRKLLAEFKQVTTREGAPIYPPDKSKKNGSPAAAGRTPEPTAR